MIEFIYAFTALIITCICIGLLRFRQEKNIIYARIHLAGAIDVMCIAIIFIAGAPLVAFAYLLLTPIANHAIAHAHFKRRGWKSD
jgi:energy-converting hydrogenase B subunit C